ncbi:MAG: 6-phosphogluconate dehydrogenase [Candidatus Poribacteria bacterium]|nr:MAG: 6-phosphogluconate dehydrogenase [Candidatus Poribacteria bacterium]
MQTVVGFVGVGRMGSNMARRLNDVGVPIAAVYDADTSKAQLLAKELGAQAAETPAQVAAASEVVFTVVTDDAAMRAIFNESDPNSLIAHASGRIFVNCATLSPSIHQEVEAVVERHGGNSIEACMASSIPQARSGRLFLMCGGRREVFERMRPLLELLSEELRYVGETGRAAQVKALVNMVMNINTAALAEGLGLGAALGLDVGMLREVFSKTGAASRVLETDGEDMEKRDHECYFSAAHAMKDSGIALRLAEEAGLNLPLARATFEQYRRLVELGLGEWDKSAIAELTFPGRTGTGTPQG